MVIEHAAKLREIARQAAEVAELIRQPEPPPPPQAAAPGGFQSSMPPYDPRASRDDRDRRLLEIEGQLRQLAQTIDSYLPRPTN